MVEPRGREQPSESPSANEWREREGRAYAAKMLGRTELANDPGRHAEVGGISLRNRAIVVSWGSENAVSAVNKGRVARLATTDGGGMPSWRG